MDQMDGGGWLGLLRKEFGLDVAGWIRVPAGTATDNFVVWDESGRRWFAKVYRDNADLAAEESAVELADFARAPGVPVPGVHRTKNGRLLARGAGRRAVSLWDYVADAETAEGGLREGRWTSVGVALGKLHRRLSAHPIAAPATQRATELHQVERARAGYDWLIAQYRRKETLDEFETWACEAAQQRRSLLDRTHLILQDLPRLTTQVLHGDLAAPNLLLRGDEVAGIIDFQPPRPRDVSWEIARIGCDPRTVMAHAGWRTGLIDLLRSYRTENPALPTSDLTSTIAVGCAYTILSTYPLAEPLKQTGPLDEQLMAYAHGRHDAALRMLDEVERHPHLLQDELTSPGPAQPGR